MFSDINIKIDRGACLGCGECVERCILDNLRLAVAPCRAACPLHKNCQGYVKYIALGKELEAAMHMKEYTPFSNILSRVCTHPCEAVCLRAEQDGQPVNIRGLKRYLADNYEDILLAVPDLAKETGFRVGIVGSGPTGMSAAYELRRKGYEVEVIECESAPGGILRWAIPSFRLPTVEVDKSISMLERMGVRFRCDSRVDMKNGLTELEKKYDAMVVASGAGVMKSLHLRGRPASNRIYAGLDLLKSARAGKLPKLGTSVIIVGGGNSAVDSALLCRRMGVKKIEIVCLEQANEMPAFPSELTRAHEEGIDMLNGYGIQSIVVSKDGAIRIAFEKCLSVLDSSGNFSPRFDAECIMNLDTDALVMAIGQVPDDNAVASALFDPVTKSPRIDRLTLQSDAFPKIFLAGDLVTGPSSVVEAMASGMRAAVSVDRFLMREGLTWGRDFWQGPYMRQTTPFMGDIVKNARIPLRNRSVSERTLTNEDEMPFSSAEARIEAGRCLGCGQPAEINRTCWSCLPCEIECPVNVLTVQMPYLIR